MKVPRAGRAGVRGRGGGVGGAACLLCVSCRPTHPSTGHSYCKAYHNITLQVDVLSSEKVAFVSCCYYSLPPSLPLRICVWLRSGKVYTRLATV